MAKVITMPVTQSKYTAVPINSREKRKVAGYARVSTDHEEQQTSYEAQMDYYTNYIKGREDWEFVSVYTDEGISATSTTKHDGFNKMVADALDGHIDLIITKSVSRFARNTVDSPTIIRKLKKHKVECYFEKENIWIFDSKDELFLTIMSSMAQEESRSISENVTWGGAEEAVRGRQPYHQRGAGRNCPEDLRDVPAGAFRIRHCKDADIGRHPHSGRQDELVGEYSPEHPHE